MNKSSPDMLIKAFCTALTLLLISCSAENDHEEGCITALDCPTGQICIDSICVDDISGDTGNTANTGDTGDTANTGDTGNTGNTANTGNTGDTADSGDTVGDNSVSDPDTVADDDTEATDGTVSDQDDLIPDDTDEIQDAASDEDTVIPPDETPVDDDPVTCTPGAVTFNYTGTEQTWTVPAGTANIQIEVWGAQGGPGATDGTALGGLGGYAKGGLAVTPGQILYIYVGEGGVYSTGGIAVSFNGGGAGRGNAVDNVRGNGGGASDVRSGGNALANRIIVAGGGGGSSGSDYLGGAGGGSSGGDGLGAFPGTGGSQSAGGISYAGMGLTDGTLGQGGSMTSTTYTLAGGGGGYYGGGGGLSAGGGSGYTGGVISGTMSNGIRSGHGQAVITIICP